MTQTKYPVDIIAKAAEIHSKIQDNPYDDTAIELIADALMEKEMEIARLAKQFVDMKSYADRLEIKLKSMKPS